MEVGGSVHVDPSDEAVAADGIAVQTDLPQVGQRCHSVSVQRTEGVIVQH